MLKKQVFAVYDSKSEIYMHPFMTQTKGEALRSFIDIANDKTHDIGKHPEDYTLFHLGEYDQATGKYENNPTPVSCGVALEMVKKEG